MDLSEAVWRKARISTENGGNCIEVADVVGGIAVRDSKDPEGPKLLVSREEFRRLAGVLKRL
ncbi:DUF397 domain-containing protein [Actinomadura sp. WAC 06369]|uniref:DUF397 domain-containing protein n=1 Tax=Actinomadura sp. WAC 06369 TaxID=2203193 RepID=UPI000F77F2A7|nr:DUF397 domain-containing protein [Actinomadura sp. WAC 06369]RSN60290.1 DUF397 domain-containing protein [Actinomadura sp. WAC 06369]